MFTLKIENRFGDILELTHNKNYAVTKVEGLNPPKGRINTASIAGMNGALFNSSKVETRNLLITVLPQEPVERNRLALYKYAQIAQWCKIYYSNGSTSVKIEGYVEAIEGSLFSRPQSFQISIVCPQPYFESLQTVYDDISSVIGLFEFPFAIPAEGTEFGIIRRELVSIIQNRGHVETGLTITITARGEVINPVIHCNSTGGSFGLNMTLAEHDMIVINTNSGMRSVKLVSGATETNVINLVTPNAEWFTLTPGENIFSYEAEVGGDVMNIVFSHNTKFGGV